MKAKKCESKSSFHTVYSETYETSFNKKALQLLGHTFKTTLCFLNGTHFLHFAFNGSKIDYFTLNSITANRKIRIKKK